MTFENLVDSDQKLLVASDFPEIQSPLIQITHHLHNNTPEQKKNWHKWAPESVLKYDLFIFWFHICLVNSVRF